MVWAVVLVFSPSEEFHIFLLSLYAGFHHDGLEDSSIENPYSGIGYCCKNESNIMEDPRLNIPGDQSTTHKWRIDQSVNLMKFKSIIQSMIEPIIPSIDYFIGYSLDDRYQ